MLLRLIVFLKSVVNIDSLALQILAIHHVSCLVTALKIVKRDKAIATRPSCLYVSFDLRREYDAKLAENFS